MFLFFQVPPLGLYAEQLNGTAFTAPRKGEEKKKNEFFFFFFFLFFFSPSANERSWLYRIRPTAGHSRFAALGRTMGDDCTVANVEQLRFKQFALPSAPTDFVDGLHAVMGAGDPTTKSGIRIYALCCNKSMIDRAFANSDGDFLFVAQEGAFELRTEFGRIHVAPGEIAVIQRGMRFSVLVEGPVRA